TGLFEAVGRGVGRGLDKLVEITGGLSEKQLLPACYPYWNVKKLIEVRVDCSDILIYTQGLSLDIHIAELRLY
ncbi:16942_t:CDS:2, partial [Dentiscutata heterogama]